MPRRDAWTDSLGLWQDAASRAIGNPVNLMELASDEGIVLCGASLTDLATAA